MWGRRLSSRKAILAIEAMEGTDRAIARGAGIATRRAVVVKMSKPNQDLRLMCRSWARELSNDDPYPCPLSGDRSGQKHFLLTATVACALPIRLGFVSYVL